MAVAGKPGLAAAAAEVPPLGVAQVAGAGVVLVVLEVPPLRHAAALLALAARRPREGPRRQLAQAARRPREGARRQLRPTPRSAQRVATPLVGGDKMEGGPCHTGCDSTPPCRARVCNSVP